MIKAFKNTKLISVLLFIFVQKICPAQYAKDTLRDQKITNIEVNSLVGFWQTDDSLITKIEFIDSSWYELTLDLKNSSNPYYFLKDNQNKVSSSGFYPNWPPLDCDLYLIDSETLEIRLSQISGAPYIIRCKKTR